MTTSPMEILKKKGLSFDQQQQSQSFSPLSNSFKRRALSGFGLGVLASLFLLFSLLLITFNSSSTASPNSSPPFSWFFSPTTTTGTSSTTATNASSSSSLGHDDNKPSNNTSSSFFANSSDLGMTHLMNLTVDDDADISISSGDQVLDQETHAFDDENNSSSSTTASPIFKNATVDLDNSISLVPQQPILEPTGQVKVEQVVDHNNAPLDNGSKEDGMHRDFDEKKKKKNKRDNGWLQVDGGSNHDDEKNATSSESSSPTNGATRERLVINEKSCNIFNGGWVKDEREAFYPAGSCPYIDNDFNCHKNGRPDDEFLKWRWQPNGCNIPSLNATDFLARLRGKRLLFVGDSLNRNMWESLVCILRHSVKRKERVYEATGSHNFKTQGYYSFKFEDYNCSVDFVRSPFLVREIFFKNASGSDDERLRLDLLDETTSAYREADIIVFNTGHWWTHEKTSRGIDYYQEGDHVYPLLKVMEAYNKALTTWARWVDKNIDSSKTKVVFRGYSLTHFRGGQWNSGGQCHKETEPIFNETFLVKYPSKMRALEGVLEQMKTPVIYLNISRLTDYRKDGHPSIYRKMYKTVEEQIDAEKSQDCSHWCLPGIPDTWNELLYASLLINGK